MRVGWPVNLQNSAHVVTHLSLATVNAQVNSQMVGKCIFACFCDPATPADLSHTEKDMQAKRVWDWELLQMRDVV